MEILLKHNVFTFQDEHYIQDIGAPMGSSPVPDYANIFMDRNIDREIEKLSEKYNTDGSTALKLLKRFLDDIFMIFCGSTKDLHRFFSEINQINPTIQLTMTHTSISDEESSEQCECEPIESVSFLDTLCSIKDGKIETEMFVLHEKMK